MTFSVMFLSFFPGMLLSRLCAGAAERRGAAGAATAQTPTGATHSGAQQEQVFLTFVLMLTTCTHTIEKTQGEVYSGVNMRKK